MTGVKVSLRALLCGSLHFFIVFACAFNGYRIGIVLLLAYCVAGFLLARLDPADYRMNVLFYLLPAVPLVGLFTVRLVMESDLRSALGWSGGLIVAALLGFFGGAVGASSREDS